ncbi:sterol regulatory element-binding protein cleavage-activating protein-like [Haliotis cracherodii]|uniref:sterol regulatory element-binding protein cleavage-activating protein-like n=1 Tax=Haliotis cracherodii TaxID=6455 RepID=UPI0039E851F6
MMQSVRERVAQIYFTHGLFCASHPYSIIVSVICVIIFTCYPLSNLPLPGNTPLEHGMALSEFKKHPSLGVSPIAVKKAPRTPGEDMKLPRWIVGDPVGVVQQVVVKTTVSPWQPQNHIPTDAFRPTLAKVFEVLEHVEHARVVNGGVEVSLSNVCLRVAESVKWIKFRHVLPQYDCLVVSPANLWMKDKHRYHKDAEIIKTVYQKFGQTLESSPTLKDVLFGVPWKETGVSRYFIRNRQRVITFAISIIMRNYSASFVDSLKRELEHHYPETSLHGNVSDSDRVVHLHYRDINYFVEYTPLLVTYFVILMYLYFSVRKIEMVKSKIGLAISALFTVVASLLVSVSVCSVFGLAPTLNGGEIFPYLVVLIGVENVLIITKSVVSTPVHLDVKIRVAKGLSKEGWFITKNLLTELFIILVGFFTFVPAIQEFCMFALVGLLSDFFLQMVFFATTLSVDIRRMELADLHKQSIHQRCSEDDTNINIEPLLRCPVMSRMTPPGSPPTSKMHRSKSAPGLDVQGVTGHHSPPPSPKLPELEMFFPETFDNPRRWKFISFWARTRMFQRLIMLCTVIWIGLIVYKTGLVDQLTSPEGVILPTGSPSSPHHLMKQEIYADKAQMKGVAGVYQGRGEEEAYTGRVGDEEETQGTPEHRNQESYLQLSPQHWPTLFSYYNISLAGRYITVLPPIRLSAIIDPQTAVDLRHSAEFDYYAHPGPDGEGHTHPIKDTNASDIANRIPYYMYDPEHLKTFYPKSKKEFTITLCLAFLSVIVISYFMIMLYKCMCSRNYSKWRRSWTKVKRRKKGYYKQIKESVPLVLKGHRQKIECLVVDGPLVVSCCWGGQLRVWDSNTGECLSAVRRRSFTPPQSRKPCVGRNIEDSDADLYAEYHGDSSFSDFNESSESPYTRKMCERSHRSSSSFSDVKPDLSSTINTQFSSIESSPGARSADAFSFQGLFEGVYEEHRHLVAEGGTKEMRERQLHSAQETQHLQLPEDSARNRSWSAGDAPGATDQQEDYPLLYDASTAVWCLACQDGYIVAGCGNGKIEIWEAESVVLKGQYDGGKSAVMALCISGKRIVAARIDGTLDFLEIETFLNPVTSCALPVSPTKQTRGHTRALSSGSGFTGEIKLWDNILHCTCIQSYRAHQQPINVLKSEGCRVVTASQDHTLKVFRQEDCLCLYTLHGHVGSVTALCLDKGPPNAAVSGSVDGDIRVWELLTGMCIHKFKGHDGAVTALDCTASYIVSLGLDDRLSVWERNRGHPLHCLDMEGAYSSCLTFLTANLLVTGGQGCLYLWDISKGELMRRIGLEDSEQASLVSHLEVVGNMGVVCDCGVDLKVIQFPTILEKFE